MIGFIRGTLAESMPGQVVVDVGGVGYELLVPTSTSDNLQEPGAQVKLLAHLHVREDAHILFGFLTTAERDLFRLLVNHVTGIGPKLALAVLSGCEIRAFQIAVVNNDVSFLGKVKGVGKKTAERIVLELKDKVGVAEVWQAAQSGEMTSISRDENDALLGLIALGFSRAESHKALMELKKKESGPISAGDMIRSALRLLR